MHRSLPGLVAAVLLSAVAARAQQLTPGAEVEIPFDAAVVGGSLYATFTGDNAPPTLVIRLPDDYVPGRAYPLLVYVPGLHGSRAGNIGNAETIAGQRSWIVASLPLFKAGVDASEVGQGILVGIEDYPAIARAYATMLGRLFELVPNIDRRRSGMVGYSNGALTLAVLLSSHDPFIRTHFTSFVLVDHGFFHLTDLHKRDLRDARYLLLVGDQPDMGRDLKLRGCALQQDSWRLLQVDVTCEILVGVGHALPEATMERIGRWLDEPPSMKAAPR